MWNLIKGIGVLVLAAVGIRAARRAVARFAVVGYEKNWERLECAFSGCVNESGMDFPGSELRIRISKVRDIPRGAA